MAQDPKSKLRHYNLGLIAQLAGDDMTATARYNTTLAIDPGYDPALYNLATITDKRGDSKGATDLYRCAISANPKGANAHFNWACCFGAWGDLETASRNSTPRSHSTCPCSGRLRPHLHRPQS